MTDFSLDKASAAADDDLGKIADMGPFKLIHGASHLDAGVEQHAAHGDDVRAVLQRRRDEPLGADVDPQVDDLEALHAQKTRDNVLADVVDIVRHDADQDLSLIHI